MNVMNFSDLVIMTNEMGRGMLHKRVVFTRVEGDWMEWVKG